MISEKYNFLFIHRGKSGGNSINEALLSLSEDEKTVDSSFQDGVDRFGIFSRRYGTNKHTPLRQYKERIPQDVFERLFKFAVLRNPYSRLVSAYFSPHRIAQGASPEFHRDEFIKIIGTEGTFRDMACLSGKGELDRDIDRVLRFEVLQEDFGTLCRDLNLPSISLNHRNASGKRSYRDFYDDELKAMVVDRFGEEIEFGGYSF